MEPTIESHRDSTTKSTEEWRELETALNDEFLKLADQLKRELKDYPQEIDSSTPEKIIEQISTYTGYYTYWQGQLEEWLKIKAEVRREKAINDMDFEARLDEGRISTANKTRVTVGSFSWYERDAFLKLDMADTVPATRTAERVLHFIEDTIELMQTRARSLYMRRDALIKIAQLMRNEQAIKDLDGVR